jgi:hypothetical protein
MKRYVLAAGVLAAVLAAAPAASLPRLAAGQRLKDGPADLDVNLYAVPFVMDWHADGKKDLLVGEYLGANPNATGKVRLYLNTNTDEAPLFSGWSYVQYGLPPADIQVTGKTDT